MGAYEKLDLMEQRLGGLEQGLRGPVAKAVLFPLGLALAISMAFAVQGGTFIAIALSVSALIWAGWRFKSYKRLKIRRDEEITRILSSHLDVLARKRVQ